MKKVLFVDDVANTFRTWQRSLAPMGFEVSIAPRPDVAIRDAAAQRPEVVLMDVKFENYDESGVPVHKQWDGVDAGVHIYHCLNIPVVFITVSPRRVATSPSGKYLADRFGLIDKTDLAWDVAKVAQQINAAISTHQTWNSKHGVIVLDDSLRVTYLNDIASASMGFRPLLQKPEGIWDAPTIKQLKEIILKAKPEAESHESQELVFLTADGKQTLHVQVRPVGVHRMVSALRCEWEIA